MRGKPTVRVTQKRMASAAEAIGEGMAYSVLREDKIRRAAYLLAVDLDEPEKDGLARFLRAVADYMQTHKWPRTPKPVKAENA